MATIKAKNNAGEWVDVAAGEAYEKKAASFKIIWVPKTKGEQSYDLSSYLLEDDDFILNFGCGFNSSTGVMCQWVGSDNQLREFDTNVTAILSNTGYGSPLYSMTKPSNRKHSFVYDREARKFYVEKGSTLGLRLAEYAGLIYAG